MNRFEAPRKQSSQLTALGHELVSIRDRLVREVLADVDRAAIGASGTRAEAWSEAARQFARDDLLPEDSFLLLRRIAPDLVDLTIFGLLLAADEGDLNLLGPDGSPLQEFGREQLAGWFMGWRDEAAAEIRHDVF